MFCSILVLTSRRISNTISSHGHIFRNIVAVFKKLANVFLSSARVSISRYVYKFVLYHGENSNMFACCFLNTYIYIYIYLFIYSVFIIL